MSLILATGSNLGDRVIFLNQAKEILKKEFKFIAESHIYESKAQDYLNQPDFLNQVLEFKIPDITPRETMQKLLLIEKQIGRERLVKYGPRVIDLDILYWGKEEICLPDLVIPHPKILERSFVVKPLLELPFANELSQVYSYPRQFENDAKIFMRKN
jgi:2-amino-4-hydroxy-6-hydroxymethyldihydropteridine diphosphokinase